MSELLIAQTKLVEKYKLAIPELERMLEHDAYYYIAGTLILNIPNPATSKTFMDIDIEPINNYASDIIRKGQYLASQIFVKHKKKTCFSYDDAVSNITEYEKVST